LAAATCPPTRLRGSAPDQGQRVDVSIEFDGKGVVTNILRLTRVNP